MILLLELTKLKKAGENLISVSRSAYLGLVISDYGFTFCPPGSTRCKNDLEVFQSQMESGSPTPTPGGSNQGQRHNQSWGFICLVFAYYMVLRSFFIYILIYYLIYLYFNTPPCLSSSLLWAAVTCLWLRFDSAVWNLRWTLWLLSRLCLGSRLLHQSPVFSVWSRGKKKSRLLVVCQGDMWYLPLTWLQ